MFRQLKTNEVALLLHGLRAVYVENEQAAHAKLTTMLETELASRGCTLGEPKVGDTCQPLQDRMNRSFGR